MEQSQVLQVGVRPGREAEPETRGTPGHVRRVRPPVMALYCVVLVTTAGYSIINHANFS